MTGDIVKTILLDNGLRLEIRDHSRPIAGGRFFVQMEALIEVPVQQYHGLLSSSGPDRPSLEKIRSVLGERAVFRQQKDRNFISEDQREAVFETMKSDFLKTNLSYLSHNNFPARFLLREYRKALPPSAG